MSAGGPYRLYPAILSQIRNPLVRYGIPLWNLFHVNSTRIDPDVYLILFVHLFTHYISILNYFIYLSYMVCIYLTRLISFRLLGLGECTSPTLNYRGFGALTLNYCRFTMEHCPEIEKFCFGSETFDSKT
jgi:hypothetical protein